MLAATLCLAEDSVVSLPISAGRDAYEPAVAFGGDTFLVAWKSGHLAKGDLRQGFNYEGDIVACRVDASGKPLDEEPISISGAADLQERPRIAFGGGVFLVVWQDMRNGKDWDVYAARVTPQGKVLDQLGIAVARADHNQALPDVAWDGKAFQVVWQDFRSNTHYEVYGARVSTAGKLLAAESEKLVSEKAPFSRINPVVASLPNGSSLLFWLGGGAPAGTTAAVSGCHLLKEGKVSAQAVFENQDARSTPGGSTGHLPFPVAIAAAKERFLVAWTTDVPYGRGNTPNDAQAAIFAEDGKLERKIVLPQVKVRGQSENRRIRHPDIAWSGEAFAMTWYEIIEDRQNRLAPWPSEKVYFSWIGTDGQVKQTDLIAGNPTAPASKPALACDAAGNVLIVYEQHPEQATRPIHIGARFVSRLVD